MVNLGKYLKGDKIIWNVVIVFTVLSILAVYSSTGTLAFRYQDGNTMYYFLKHGTIMLFGLMLMFLVHRMNYSYFSRLSQIGLFIVIPLLAVTLLFGTNINEANRWLRVPLLNITFQTSDLAKLVLILYLSRLLAKYKDSISKFHPTFTGMIIPVLLVCILILPANLSTAALLFATSVFLMFVGRVKWQFLLSLIGIGLAGLVFVILLSLYSSENSRVGTWKKRIEAYVSGDVENNYQVNQSKIAIATGGIFGKGPGKSVQRNYLPHPYSDFIFAVIIEEYGFIGAIILVLGYLALLYRSFRIVIKSKSLFGAYLTLGIIFTLVFQALINMAVAVGLIPVTGQPLPMVSMGGTSLWFTCISIGLILSVSRENENNVNNKTESVAHA